MNDPQSLTDPIYPVNEPDYPAGGTLGFFTEHQLLLSPDHPRRLELSLVDPGLCLDGIWKASVYPEAKPGFGGGAQETASLSLIPCSLNRRLALSQVEVMSVCMSGHIFSDVLRCPSGLARMALCDELWSALAHLPFGFVY